MPATRSQPPLPWRSSLHGNGPAIRRPATSSGPWAGWWAAPSTASSRRAWGSPPDTRRASSSSSSSIPLLPGSSGSGFTRLKGRVDEGGGWPCGGASLRYPGAGGGTHVDEGGGLAVRWRCGEGFALPPSGARGGPQGLVARGRLPEEHPPAAVSSVAPWRCPLPAPPGGGSSIAPPANPPEAPTDPKLPIS